MPIIATIGDANIIGNTVSQGNLNVLSTFSNLVGNLFVNYTATLANLVINRNSTFSGPVIANGNVTTNSNLFALQINVAQVSNLNQLEVRGGSNLYSNINVFANLGILSNLFVQNCAYINNTLNVSGESNLLSTLRVQGAANLLSTLEVGTSINTPSLTTTTLANLTSLLVVTNTTMLGNLSVQGSANVTGNANILGSNTTVAGTLTVGGTTVINNTLTVSGQTNLLSPVNLFSTLYVVGQSNILGPLVVQNALTAFSTLTVLGDSNLAANTRVSNLNVTSFTSLNFLNVAATTVLQQSLNVFGQTNFFSLANAASLTVAGTSNLAVLGVTNNVLVGGNLIVNGNSNTSGTMNVLSNISTPGNVIVGSNIVSGAGGSNTGNVLMSGNLVVQGNIYFTSGALGTIGGLTLTTTSNVQLSSPFSADANGNAYSLPLLTPFQVKGTSAFIYVSNGGNIKFQLPGTYVLSGFFPGDATVLKVAVGSSATDTHPTTKNYFYIQNFTATDRFNIPLVITDQTLYYYIDIYTSTAGSNLAPTYATLGSSSGTFVSVTPHGTFIPQALNYPQTWTNVIGSSNIYNFGSVGIGTTNPQSNLAVVGAMSLGSYSLSGIAAPSNSFIVSGQVGVGTATPTANLYVAGNIVSTTNVTSVGFANVGSVLINGTQLIDASRNFTNVGTMSTGIITSTQVALAGFKNIVYRQPIWGVGGRVGGFRVSIPYGPAEVDSTLICNINIPFSKSSPATGASRRYRIFMTYILFPNFNGVGGSGTFKIRCSTASGTYDFVITADPVTTVYSNSVGTYQDSLSTELSISDSSNIGGFVLRVNPQNFSQSLPFNIEIDYLELQTLDNY
jgi:hypothetical protein